MTPLERPFGRFQIQEVPVTYTMGTNHGAGQRVGDFTYDRMIVVTEQDGGRELFLQGWIGPPLPLSHWRAAKAALFPNAEVVTWERREADGKIRHVRMSI